MQRSSRHFTKILSRQVDQRKASAAILIEDDGMQVGGRRKVVQQRRLQLAYWRRENI
jgi:hypothetical protein